MSLVDEVAAARRAHSYIIANPGEWPLGVAGRLADTQATLLRELSDMECCTRFMPLTRQALDTNSLGDPTLIAEEVRKHIDRLRANRRYVAHHREARLALFTLSPTIKALRAVWILK